MRNTMDAHVRHRARHARPPAAIRRPTVPHGLAITAAVLTLLALLGRAVTSDCQAVQAMLEVWRHLQQFGS